MKKPAEITSVEPVAASVGGERLYRVHYTVQAEPKTEVESRVSFFADDEMDAYMKTVRMLRRAGYQL